jgi:conjugal transfer pilus assembly protein TraW
MRRLLWAVAVVLGTGGALASEPARPVPEDRALLEQAQRIEAAPDSVLTAEDIKILEASAARNTSDAERREFETLFEQGKGIEREAMQVSPLDPGQRISPVGPVAPTRIVYLFVSQSMGDAGLKAAIEAARGREDVNVILRGVNPGQGIGELFRVIGKHHQIQHTDDAAAAVSINPEPFRRHVVQAVPTLLVEDGGARVAEVRGLVNADWLLEKVKDGKRGDLGQHGETSEVSERDMLEVVDEVHKRADEQYPVTEETREASYQRYWDGLRFTDLPVAREDRVREVDPSFVVSKTITTPDGTVIATAGQKVNPLDHLPFTQRLIVFDATDPAQRELVQQAKDEAQGRRVTLISTRYQREGGFAGLMEVWEEWGEPIYLLQSDVQQRFKIERVPSVVDGGERVFLVRELAVPLEAL